MKKALFISLLMTGSMLFAAAQDGGKTGLQFLKIPVDARAAGMGEAYTAVSSDASATYWNPAGLTGSTHSNVLFSHNEWIQGVRGEYAALALRRSRSVWAFHIRSLNVGDIPVRIQPSEEPLDHTGAHYLSAGLSYARAISSRLSLGGTVKYLFEKIYVETASGFAADLGVSYRTNLNGLSVAAVLQNLGSMNNLLNESTKLPAILRAGAAYRLPAFSDFVKADLAVDLVKPFNDNFRQHVGGELLFWNQIAVRSGYLSGYDSRSFTFGVGFMRSSIRLDYSISPFNDELGNGQRFSVNFNL